jgi:site-specific DNA-methyltransferase (adenine-specific)
MNTLYYGDNLDILRNYIPDESVDLIYLDPPFNSNRTYNVLFKDESGEQSASQIAAFEDTWHWDLNTESIYKELVTSPEIPSQVSSMIAALRDFIGTNQMMAYLTNMTIRLVELHRILKSTGSLYLHCDPTASHYLKIVLDAVFGIDNFKNEIIWKRTSAHSSAKRFGSVHDVLLFYSKTHSFNWIDQYLPYDKDYIELFFDTVDEFGKRYKRSDLTGAGISQGESGKSWRGIDVTAKGRHWMYVPSTLEKLDASGRIHWPKKKGGMPRLKQYPQDLPGVPAQDVWIDISPLHNLASERLGYPTQKPQELLDRIISASSNPGDIVLDPFCGCGTAIASAQSLGRQWIGIDVTHLAISLIKYRLEDSFPGIEFDIQGEPESVNSARYLAESDRHQFEWWALSLIRARPGQPDGDRGKKGADRGIDGIINFIDDSSGKPQKAIVQVKSGHVSSAQIRDLVGTMNRTQAPIGIFISLEEPTKPMLKEAAEVGFYHSTLWNKDYPKLQILTIEELLKGKELQLPPSNVTFQKAQKQKGKSSNNQLSLLGGKTVQEEE